MEKKIQLKHPAGKKAIRMDKLKYDPLKKAILSFLQANGESTHSEIVESVTKEFKKNKTKFEGSIEWHTEWVKLDLEARKEIKRTADKSSIKFSLVMMILKVSKSRRVSA